MCVIAVKPSNVEMPAEEKLKLMWDRNPDGAGFMYTYDNTVTISKGFMTFEDFMRNLNDVKTLVEGGGKSLKDIPFVLHFRITTHGGTSPENTHPFPITNKEEYLKALDVKCDIGMAHNGVISGLDRETEVSDTQIYIRDILYDLSVLDKGFVKRFTNIISLTKGSSRLAFLNKNGEISMFGDFVELDEKDGLYYSNKLFVPSKKTTYSQYSYTKYFSDALVNAEDLNEDDKYEIRDDKDLPYWIEKHKGDTLYYMEDTIQNTYGYFKTFLSEKTGETIYLDPKYLKLKETKKSSTKKDKDSNKHNIGGRKCRETKKILQNADRLLYKETTYKTFKLRSINRESTLVDKLYIDSVKFGDYAYVDDFKVYVSSNNWFFNISDKHYYYKQKDGSLMRIEKDEVFAEIILDDSLNYTGYIEGTLSQNSVTFTNVKVYTLKK